MRVAVGRLPETNPKDLQIGWRRIGLTLCGFRTDLPPRADGAEHNYDDDYYSAARDESGFKGSKRSFGRITAEFRKQLAKILLEMEEKGYVIGLAVPESKENSTVAQAAVAGAQGSPVGGPHEASKIPSDDSLAQPPAEKAGGSWMQRIVYAGARSLLRHPATIAVTALVVAAALTFEVQQHFFSSSSSISQGPAPGSKTSASGSGVVINPPATAIAGPTVVAKVDTNPLDLSSPALVNLYGTNEDWLIPHGITVTGDPGQDANSFYAFANHFGAVPVNRLFFKVTVQNLTEGAVYLSTMQLSGLTCSAPLKGTRIVTGGGADYSPPRVILINLDSARPAPLYFAKFPETFIPSSTQLAQDLSKYADPFGFTLAKGQTESFDIFGSLRARRSCQFKLAIKATLNGVDTIIPVTDSGKPFKITGEGDSLNFWFYTPGASGMEWWNGVGAPRTVRKPGEALTETDR
jgi:hypothetical protein